MAAPGAAVLLAASFFAGAGITAGNTADVSASIAGRFALHRLRLGSIVDAAFGLGPNVRLRPLASCD